MSIGQFRSTYTAKKRNKAFKDGFEPRTDAKFCLILNSEIYILTLSQYKKTFTSTDSSKKK